MAVNSSCFDEVSSMPDDILWAKLLLLEDEESGQMQPLTEYLSYCANEKQRRSFADWYRDRYLPARRLLHPQETLQYDQWKQHFSHYLKSHWSEE